MNPIRNSTQVVTRLNSLVSHLTMKTSAFVRPGAADSTCAAFNAGFGAAGGALVPDCALVFVSLAGCDGGGLIAAQFVPSGLASDLVSGGLPAGCSASRQLAGNSRPM